MPVADLLMVTRLQLFWKSYLANWPSNGALMSGQYAKRFWIWYVVRPLHCSLHFNHIFNIYHNNWIKTWSAIFIRKFSWGITSIKNIPKALMVPKSELYFIMPELYSYINKRSLK